MLSYQIVLDLKNNFKQLKTNFYWVKKTGLFHILRHLFQDRVPQKRLVRGQGTLLLSTMSEIKESTYKPNKYATLNLGTQPKCP